MATEKGGKADTAEELAALHERIAYLERRLARRELQQIRQERIDDINRHLLKHVGRELEQALILAEQGSRAKSEFLASMSHEIRSPLNIIFGMGELLAETTLNQRQQSCLNSLLLASRQLHEQLSNVLEFSRLEGAEIVVQPEPFRFDLLLTSLQAMMETLAREKGLHFEVRGPARPLASRLGDLPKVKQILFNLLGNALKYTDQGSITLTVEEVPDEQTAGMLRFVVSDTGIGIPPGQLESIFDHFSRADNALATSRGGAGLGLAICRKLVAALQGELAVRSALGRGSTFTLLLPLPPAAHHRPAVEEPRPMEEAGLLALSSLRLLLAEDVAGNVEVVRQYLAPYDVEIDHVGNGAEAVRRFAERRYDIVLMDIRMPGMDGITATRWINQLGGEGGGPPVPVIAVTAHAFPEQVLSYLQRGFAGVLTKPFTRQDLLKTLNHFLRLSPNVPAPSTTPAAVGRADQVPASLAPLLGQVLDALEGDLEKMAAELRSGSLAALAESCHAGKGLAGLYGLHQYASLLAALEGELAETVEGALPPAERLAPMYDYLRRRRAARAEAVRPGPA